MVYCMEAGFDIAQMRPGSISMPMVPAEVAGEHIRGPGGGVMTILDKLASVRAAPIDDRPSIAYAAYTHDDTHPFRVRRQSIARGDVQPLVSCLMVTRGDRWTIRYALESYRRQTYPDRELVIVVDTTNLEAVSALVAASGADRVSLFGVDPDLTLGDCRNMSIARAQGDVLVQWDDDDLYDPARIDILLSVLMKASTPAAALSRWLVWWPDRDLAAISSRRIWEGSMAVWRSQAPVYPRMVRGEDTFAADCIASLSTIAAVDAPLSYVYVINGGNVFDVEHFEKIIRHADYVARGDDYYDLIALLSLRMPIVEYRTAMLDRR